MTDNFLSESDVAALAAFGPNVTIRGQLQKDDDRDDRYVSVSE